MALEGKDASQIDKTMADSNYPSLYKKADSASIKAQNFYLRLHKIFFGSLILVSILGTISSLEIPGKKVWVHAAVTFVLVVGIMVFWIIRARRDDKVWFDGRAVAESVKSTAWRYMMKIPPFHENGVSDIEFGSQLREICKARAHLAKPFVATINAEEPEITDFMRKKRSIPIEERKTFYIENRLVDQKSWYLTKSKFNVDKGTQWFWVIAVMQIAAVGCFVQAGIPHYCKSFSPVEGWGIFMPECA